MFGDGGASPWAVRDPAAGSAGPSATAASTAADGAPTSSAASAVGSSGSSERLEGGLGGALRPANGSRGRGAGNPSGEFAGAPELTGTSESGGAELPSCGAGTAAGGWLSGSGGGGLEGGAAGVVSGARRLAAGRAVQAVPGAVPEGVFWRGADQAAKPGPGPTAGFQRFRAASPPDTGNPALLPTPAAGGPPEPPAEAGHAAGDG